MKRIARSDIVDYQTYEELRPDFRRRVMGEKNRRRVLLDPCFNFLFENDLTLRYQVQEMMRAERIVRERDIEQELATYNSLLGGPGELACTLLIELSDSEERALKLHQWLDLPEHIYLRLADGRLVRPRVDPGQRSEERISSVQYLKFPVGGAPPVAVGIDLPGVACESLLTEEQRAALAEDLGHC